MAAVLQESEDHSDTDVERRTVFEWVFDYYCYVFWEEFKEHFTIDSRSERRLLEGIPMYGVSSTPTRQVFAHFMSLLSRLADGTEHNIEYSDPDEPDTPLEGALLVFENLMDMMHTEHKLDPKEIMNDIKTQAVLVCCRANDYATAGDVYDRLWGNCQDMTQKEKDIAKILRRILKSESLKSVAQDMSWKKFQKNIICFLQQIYEQITEKPPFLCLAARKWLQIEGHKKRLRNNDRSATVDDSDKEESHNGAEEQEDAPPRRSRRRMNQRKRRHSSSSTGVDTDVEQEAENGTGSKHNLNRVMPYHVLQAVSREMGCTDFGQGDQEEIISEVAEAIKKQKNKNSSEAPITIVLEGEELEDRIAGDSPMTSTPREAKDQPSTSTTNETRKNGIQNKENDSPRAKRGRVIRDQKYQPGRANTSSTRSTNRNSNSNVKSYIDWSSNDEDSDSVEEEETIFNKKLVHKKVRKSLALESFSNAHKLRKPTQRMPWTADEEQRLRKGVAKCGRGNWATIKEKYKFVLRTSVNLKDKWRNMEKNGITGVEGK